MGGVEILVGAETAGSHGFGVGTVRLMGIGIGRRGGGVGRRRWLGLVGLGFP